MVNELISRMTLVRWIIAAVVIASVVVFSLFQFSSFQIPKTLTPGKLEPKVHDGIKPSGSTKSKTNLDRVYEKIHKNSSNGPVEGVEGDKR